MDSDWMNDMAARLAALGVNVLRFEFPYMVQRRVDGGKRPPNPAPKLLECWREVYAGGATPCHWVPGHGCVRGRADGQSVG